MTTVVVVIPVHDEEELLGRCLASVDAAARAVAEREHGLRVEVVVVLDACTDRSSMIAREWPVSLVRTEARRVGAARRAGVERALELCGTTAPAQVWLAHTDADSEVPGDWLACQIELMREGVDVMLGTVRPDFADLSSHHIEHWLRTHPRGRPAGNVHGANLGIRASAYLAAGGFHDVAEHEDVGLVERARSSGAVIRVTDECEVSTSGRFTGRTPGGYAGFVRGVHEMLSGRDGVA